MGVTLIEVIISIALIAIISVGVYNAYLLLIRQTKEGQVKQISTLLGKQISEEIKSGKQINEEIKSASDNKGIKPSTTAGAVSLNLTKYGENYASELYFDEQGKQEDSKSRYTAEINLKPYKTLGDNNNVSLDEISSSKVIYVIGINGKAIGVDVNSLPGNPSNLEGSETIKIEMKEQSSCTITTDSNTLDYYFDTNKDKKPRIDLDLKYCKGKTTVTVDNETKISLNLCILNNNNVEIENEKGILNEYYRSNAGSKIGVLYDVNIAISDERENDNSKNTNDKPKYIFNTSFVQNINIK